MYCTDDHHQHYITIIRFAFFSFFIHVGVVAFFPLTPRTMTCASTWSPASSRRRARPWPSAPTSSASWPPSASSASAPAPRLGRPLRPRASATLRSTPGGLLELFDVFFLWVGCSRTLLIGVLIVVLLLVVGSRVYARCVSYWPFQSVALIQI